MAQGLELSPSAFQHTLSLGSECALEGLMLKLKLQYFGHLMLRADLLEKTLILERIEGRRKGWDGWVASLTQLTCVYVCLCVWVTQLCLSLCDPMDCNLPAPLSMEFSRQEYEFGQIPGESEAQGSLSCCSSWGHNFATEKKTSLLYRMNWEYSSGLSVLNGQKITHRTPALPLPLPPHLMFPTK